jgi:disulfide bond formation protein DsbB
MSILKKRNSLNLILLFCVSALIAAYIIEYILGHQPCNLCLIQRIPYITVIIIISLCLFFKKFEKITLITLSLVFFLATLLSIYHFGIEQGFIKDSLVCNLNAENPTLTKEALLNQLKEITTSCKNVTFRIFGLSLATINIFISLVLSLITIKLFLSYEKN